jgi:UDP-2,3-diacylglucosamine hydrolase
MQTIPESLAVVAGKGAYPLLLADSARQQGVARIFALAFRGETDKAMARLADETVWINMGQMERMLQALRQSGARHAVMAGLIRPTHLFRAFPDARLRQLLGSLSLRNAHTIFGAVGDAIRDLGIAVLPASSFMQAHMPTAGALTRRRPDAATRRDIDLGLQVARATSDMDIGQTVVVKQGTILAIEAFEGTDETLLRAGRLGGPGAVIVKLAKHRHDMRFDIPVTGLRTLRIMRKIKAAGLALESGRCIVLEREKVIAAADRANLCIEVVAPLSSAPSETRSG